MSLSASLTAALSGLRATQTSLEVVSNNVANAGTAGYTRKSSVLSARVAGTSVSGVDVVGVNRSLDLSLQRQLWTESAGAAYAGTAADFLDRLQQIFGTPGSATALDSVVNGFGTSLDALVTTPDSAAARADVLSSGQLLAQTLNSATERVQTLRAEADSGLRSSVADANQALETIDKLSRQLVSSGQSTTSSATLLDQRDAAIAQLSSLMDIRVVQQDNNQITIFTGSGNTLYDGEPAKLTFDGGTTVNANTLYDRDPSKSGVGTVMLETPSGAKIDMLAPGMVRSGSIHAYAELRDDTLVSAQDELDALAASLATALGSHEVAGTAASSGGASGFDLDVSDLAAGNPITLSFTQTPPGVERTVTVVRVDDASKLPLSDDLTTDPNDAVIGIDFSGGTAAAASALQSALDGRFGAGALAVSAPAGGTLRVLDDGAAGTTSITGLQAEVTATATSGEGLALPFFVDATPSRPYTGSLDGTPQSRGFAGRITVNAALMADPALLVKHTSTTDAGDPSRPAFLKEALADRSRTFTQGLSNFTGSIAEFASHVIDGRARQAETASSVATGQAMVLDALDERYGSISGVDVNDEMANLIQLQTAYAANARVVTAIKDMIDKLLSM